MYFIMTPEKTLPETSINPELEVIIKLLERASNRTFWIVQTNIQTPISVNAKGEILGSDGEYYQNTREMQNLVKTAIFIRRSTPQVPDGFIRLWRGNRKGEVWLNPSYTNSLEGIALPFLMSYKWPLSYIDVSIEELWKYECKTWSASQSEFILPPELVRECHIVGLSFKESEQLKSESKPEETESNPWAFWGG